LLPVINALEDLGRRPLHKSFARHYEALKDGVTVDWMALERDIVRAVMVDWRQRCQALSGSITLPMLAEFFQDANGKSFIDADDPYAAKRYKSLLSAINDRTCDESSWDFAVRLMRTLSSRRKEVAKRFRDVAYARLHSGLESFMRQLEEDADDGLAYFLDHNRIPPTVAGDESEFVLVQELIRRKGSHKIRLLSREGYHSVSSRLGNPQLIVLATQVFDKSLHTAFYLTLLPRQQEKCLQYLEPLLMAGRFRDYQAEFMRIQTSVVQQELQLETARQRRTRLRASLGRCLGYAIAVGACGAVVGGLLGNLLAGSMFLWGLVAMLLAGTFTFGTLRYRMARSVQVTTLHTHSYPRVDCIPRMLVVPNSGEAREYHCAGLQTARGRTRPEHHGSRNQVRAVT
jgi:hypothetical protein